MSNTYYVLRHGTCSHNTGASGGGIVGPFEVGLTEQGVLEAVTLREHIRSSGAHFDAAYSSPLTRAHNTLLLALGLANPVYTAEGKVKFECGFPALTSAEDVPLYDGGIRPDLRLQERNFGELFGCRRDDVVPKFGHKYGGKSPVSAVDITPEGGESLRDKYRQIVAFIQELEQRHSDAHILISTHGGPSGLISIHLQHGSLDAVVHDGEINDKLIQPPNGKLLVYERSGSQQNYIQTKTIG